MTLDVDVAENESDFVLTDEEHADLIGAEADPLQISHATQDFDVDGLVRRMRDEDIKIPQYGHKDPEIVSAGFQRSVVWTKPQMDRFVESLLLGYPVPGIFLVRQQDGLYLVLDGQQRLRALRAFYDEIHEKKQFELTNVATEFKGLRYSTLQRDQKRRLDNSFISATIVDTDGSERSLQAVYQIFERLNSGGTQLTPHEIRVALFAGPLIDELERLNSLSAWRSIYGGRSSRLRDQELVLRIVALYLDHANYFSPLKGFLNDFMSTHRRGSSSTLTEAAALFEQAASVLVGGPGQGALRKGSRQVNTAQTDAVFVGLMTKLSSGDDVDPTLVAGAVDAMKADPAFDDATAKATANEDQVTTRLRIAIDTFAAL